MSVILAFRYVIVENLRYMLYPYSPNQLIYFGCKFKPFVKQGYMSGGAGYVLSKESVKKFVEEGISNPTKCRQDEQGAEDVEIGMKYFNKIIFLKIINFRSLCV